MLTKKKGKPTAISGDSSIEPNQTDVDKSIDKVQSLPKGMIRYIDNKASSILISNDSQSFDVSSSNSNPPPSKPTICTVPNCNQSKKYIHSKLFVPICSLKCYKIVDKNKKTIK